MKLKILTPVQHGVDLYQEGDIADIKTHDANALIKVGAAEIIDSAAVKAKAKTELEASEALAKAEAEVLAIAEAEAAAKAEAEANAAGSKV